MTSSASNEAPPAEDASLVTAQIGRPPRTPWRVAVRCERDRPSVIASPSRLDDGALFPTLFWLTCPRLAQAAGALESGGATAHWAARASAEPDLAARLRAADAALVELRAAESHGRDACAGVGLAGQRDPNAVKCLHAHLALALAGIDDPIGGAVLAQIGRACPDDVCARFAQRSNRAGHEHSAPAGEGDRS